MGWEKATMLRTISSVSVSTVPSKEDHIGTNVVNFLLQDFLPTSREPIIFCIGSLESLKGFSILAYNKAEKRNIRKIRPSQLPRRGTQRLCHLSSCCTHRWWPLVNSYIEKFQNGTLKHSIKAMKAHPQTFVFRVFWEGRVVAAGRNISKCKLGLLSVKRTPRTLPKQKRLLGPM